VNRLMHVSGEWLEEECLLPLDKNNAQGAGSAVTYARRYSLQSIAGVVADEDDDANAASVVKKEETKVEADPEAKKKLEACGSLDSLQKAWLALTPAQRSTSGPIKDAMKEKIIAADKAAVAA
jgi:hypothetical protein